MVGSVDGGRLSGSRWKVAVDVAVALLLGVVIWSPPAVAQSEGELTTEVLKLEDHEFFESRVRPVFVRRCLSCHGEDEVGDFRMDSLAALMKGGPSGPGLVPGEPDRSLLILAVRFEMADLKMPMKGGKLPADQIADLEEWVRRGAPWPGEAAAAASVTPTFEISAEQRAFWSFQPLIDPPVPVVADSSWARTPIDRFVLARLEAEGLKPSARATPHEQLRRVFYDLTGLPPTAEEVETFAADPSDEAFAAIVDRLLASPHYGERWGRHWLDVVRYGEDDTRGLADDGSGREKYPTAYTYRDWVIAAFNNDLPFDRFVTAQLAADLLPEADRPPALGGLGLLGGGPWYYDIAAPEIARADERHDRVDVTTRGFLGLTIGCARCHDHKYDPVSIGDYYALAGVFGNTVYHEYPLAPKKVVEPYDREKKRLEALKKARRKYLQTESEQLMWVLTYQAVDYMVAAWKVTGEPQESLTDVVTAGELDLETLQRWINFLGREPKHYPYLVDWQTMIAGGGSEERATELARSFQAKLLEIDAARDKLREKNEYIIANGSVPPDQRKSVPMPNGFESFFDKHQLELESLEREDLNLWMDVYDHDLEGTTDYYNFDPALLEFEGWGLERRLSPTSLAHAERLKAEIEALEKSMGQHYPFVLGVADKPEDEIVDLPLHLRGSPTNLGDPVPRLFPQILTAGEPIVLSEGSGRLALAGAIVAHPITARVIVNRVWHWHFGRGLVDTPSNFGASGSLPSHPELLDFLASRFVESGMSIKSLHRDILASSVYRVSALADRQAVSGDPDNRLFGRANRRRLDAEGIRDSLLVAAGTLDPKVGGPSLSLDAPDNVRRTVYSEISRFQLHTYLQTFDFPNPSLTAEKRFSTNVPLQSLYFMNSDFVKRQAEAFVERVDRLAWSAVEPQRGVGNHGGESALDPEAGIPSVEERIRIAYRLALSRDPEDREIQAGVDFLETLRGSSAGDAAVAAVADAGTMKEVVAEPVGVSGEQPVDDSGAGEVAVAEAAEAAEAEALRWFQYSRALFASNEFRFVN